MTPRLVESHTGIRELNEDFLAHQHSPEAGRKLQKLFEEVAREWSTGQYDAPEVETWTQFRSRVAKAVGALKDSAAKSSSTVVFTSAGPIAAALGTVLDLNAARTVEFVWLSRNASYSQFLFSGDRFSLHAYNAIPHLDSLQLLTYR